MSIGLAFESETSSNTISVPYPAFMFGKFGNHVIRAVINRFDTFKFSNLKDSYSNLESIKNFIKGYSYLAGINILVYAKQEVLDDCGMQRRRSAPPRDTRPETPESAGIPLPPAFRTAAPMADTAT